ncbi:MAG TPA: protein kinase [Vicinamibacterales bacterium]|nr:protein kinase [Vicinamibacterales bacterium]
MTFRPGQTVGRYEIVGLLGAGGMGEVYRARDLTLKRDIAIKILPDAFSRDAERLSRFRREAEVLAALSHPHIATIYDFGECGDGRFLALELVEGETLADRLVRGPLTLDESLRTGIQIAQALEAAHGRGITHRDLKPANIQLTPAGDVKVLDFGLAKVATDTSTVSDSPTTMAATAQGMIVGTVPYMSPEHVKGQEGGNAADIWAFGCVLYEMLCARRAFDGDSASEILASVLKSEPDWRQLPPIPDGIARLIRRCLRKDRTHRLQSIGDVRIELEDALREPSVDTNPVSRGTPKWVRAVVAALALAALITAVSALTAARPPTAPEMRLEISGPATTSPASLAISPDGLQVVYLAELDQRPQLWIRRLDSDAARPLPGTDYAQLPFWSPDSKSLGFFGGGKLKRLDIAGGSPKDLADAPQGYGGAWNEGGTIIFCANNRDLFRISAEGGEPIQLTHLQRPQQTSHRHPWFLPDGRHFLYFATGPEGRGIYVDSLDESTPKRLLGTDTDGGPALTSSGQLLFVRKRALFAQDLDPKSLVLKGTALLLAEPVIAEGTTAAFSASSAGPIVYRMGSEEAGKQLIWFDRSGKEMERVGSHDSANLWMWSLSPDGRRVAINRTVKGDFDVWLLEARRGLLTRFTVDPAFDWAGVWSPDSTRIAYRHDDRLYERSVAGAPGTETPLLSSTTVDTPTDWSIDGRYLVFQRAGPKTGLDLWALPFERDGRPGTPIVVAQTDAAEQNGQLSADGKWIAYQSNESGQAEIYVQPFPGPGPKSRVSTNGGIQVRWRLDGRELFYLAADGRLMAVPIRAGSSGSTIEPGAATPLFWTHMSGAAQSDTVLFPQYSVSPDGQRFLMNTLSQVNAGPITVVLNGRFQPSAR